MRQESVPDLLKKFHDGDAAEQKAAGDALVKKGVTAKVAVQKALDKAGSDLRARYEDLLIRIECGTDSARETFGSLDLELRDAGASQEPVPEISIGIRLKTIFEGTNNGTNPVVVTITKGALVTSKGRFDLLVKGAKGEPFTRTFDPASPKMVEYGAILSPRFPPGTRVALVFEVDMDGTKKLMRSAILTIVKKD